MIEKKLFCAALSLLAVAGTGCWTVAYHADTGEKLLPAPAAGASSSGKVVVGAFRQLEYQDFDHRTDVHGGDLTFSWKTAEGSHDIARYVASALRGAGYADVTYQPDERGQLHVEGYVERWERKKSPGKVAWVAIAGTIQMFTLCLLPLYFETLDLHAMVHMEVYDAEGRVLARRREPATWNRRSTCVWGVLSAPDYEAVGRASGTLLAKLLREVQASGSLTAPAVAP
jgi:hypothetical protein